MHIKWGQYRQLFAQSQRRVDLINQAAGHFFRILQDALFEDIILHLARLTDPAQSGHKHKSQDNLSLWRLQMLVPETLSVEVADLVQEALAACSAPRVWRNKRLAHRDLTVALATADDPLSGISRGDVERRWQPSAGLFIGSSNTTAASKWATNALWGVLEKRTSSFTTFTRA